MHPFWSESKGWFFDVEWEAGELQDPTDVLSLAAVMPLFVGMADQVHADRVAEKIQSDFLKPGGLVATTEDYQSGQQWDFPIGWPPLQWLAVAGLSRYGYESLARDIAYRFVSEARRVYEETGRMSEKYDVSSLGRSVEYGEYANQEGFGWTNGVVLALLNLTTRTA